jgi:uncharacterized protein YjiS (DUF1127 family)
MQWEPLDKTRRTIPADVTETMMMTRITNQIDRWRRMQATQRVLEALDARALKDVGLYRRTDPLAYERVMLRTLGMR